MPFSGTEFVFLAVFFSFASAEEVYKWDKTKILPLMKPNNWRATSFAISEDKIFLTLVDIDKQESGNGIVGFFNISASMSPDVTIFPFQNFYKINEPIRGKVTTPMSVRTDDCDRLWLLDSAVQNISGVQMKTNPGIYVFNIDTNQLIRSFNIPTTQWTSTSFFVNFVVDTVSTEHDCEESYGYFADFNRFHLLTYDFLRNRSELKSHPFFSPDPLIHIPNDLLFNRGHQDLNGVYGLALVQYHDPNMVNTLYFHSLASTHEFRVNTRILRQEGNINYHDVEVYKDKGKNAESGVSVFDRETNTIFFAEVTTKKIGALRLKDLKNSRLATYYKYDLGLKEGYIVDLNIRRSELWLLVDEKFHVSIHKLSIAFLGKNLHSSGHQQTVPPKSNGADHIVLHLALIFFSLNTFL